MNTNVMNKKDIIAEERELCKVVLGWTVIGFILGFIVYTALTGIGSAVSLAGTEFTIAGIFFTASLIAWPVLLARRAER